MNEFEQFLKKQPLRELPLAWRKEILHALPEPKAARPWWQEWLWPSPFAWAGLACAWLTILAVNMAASPTVSERQMVKQSPMTSQEIALALTQQRKEWAQLLEFPQEYAAETKRSGAPGPRSEIPGVIRGV